MIVGAGLLVSTRPEPTCRSTAMHRSLVRLSRRATAASSRSRRSAGCITDTPGRRDATRYSDRRCQPPGYESLQKVARKSRQIRKLLFSQLLRNTARALHAVHAEHVEHEFSYKLVTRQEPKVRFEFGFHSECGEISADTSHETQPRVAMSAEKASWEWRSQSLTFGGPGGGCTSQTSRPLIRRQVPGDLRISLAVSEICFYERCQTTSAMIASPSTCGSVSVRVGQISRPRRDRNACSRVAVCERTVKYPLGHIFSRNWSAKGCT